MGKYRDKELKVSFSPEAFLFYIYIDFYGINNLWKVNLPSFYRMLYTIDTSAKIVINSVIIAIIDHERYNKIFGYRKK